MTHQKEPNTFAGARLRALRAARGKPQFDVELEAGLGIGYLQRLELGKVRHPERETLDRILAALGASFAERREVLGAFGYTVPFAIPTDAETRRAVDVFQAEAQGVAFPAYLLDCTHRLLAWNRLVPELYAVFQSSLASPLIPRLIFDPAYGIAPAVRNADAFFGAEVRILQYEQQRCGDTDWYAGFIDGMRRVALFDRYWRRESSALAPIPMRPLASLELDTGRGLARFRLVAETFAQDERFRVIHYLPADPPTMRQCLDW